ncbi:MAG: hypothetical protein Pg6C_11520 [Treponemataceae bacterium]|nr:MAG: hypothetical protein Pg6C_11520 [Treponemataceae bacterium]
MYIAKKNGRVYCHKSLDGLKQFGIIKADMEIPDAEFEAAGSVARLVDGKIFIGKTEAEAQAEHRQSRQVEIENLLKSIDTKSGRAARAVALAVAGGETPAGADVSRLAELEAEARNLRSELQGLLSA